MGISDFSRTFGKGIIFENKDFEGNHTFVTDRGLEEFFL